MGNTGKSEANHLHYEVYVGGASTSNRRNPLDYTYVYDGQIVHPDDTKKVKYKPKETTPSTPKVDEKDKKIQELQTKVNELTKEVEENNIEINKLKSELEEANSYKLKYIAEVTGTHDIELDKNDILIIK